MYQTDIEIYEDSLNLLVENLNKNVESLDSDYVVALSRKGPRLLEYLKKSKGLKPINVITSMLCLFCSSIFVKLKMKMFDYI